jgi:septal ring factor EnvC (AmiA/AmiB activator)
MPTLSKTCQRILLFASLLGISFSLHAQSAADIARKQNELNHIKGHIQRLKQTLSQDQNQQSDLENQLKNSELMISKLGEQIKSLDDEFAAEEVELEKLKKTQQSFMARLATQRTTLAQQIRLVYYLGKTQALKTILNPDDTSSISRHIYYYHALSSARMQYVAEIKQILDTLDSNMAAMTEHETHLKALLVDKQEEQHQQQLAQEQRQQIILHLNASAADKQQQIQSLVNNQNGLQSMLVTLQTQAAELPIQSFTHLHGKLQWPIQGPKLPSFSALEEPDQHASGIVLKAPEGTPVHAIYGGKVVFADWLRGFGLLVIINHGNGFMSLYARNHALYAKTGDTVKPREVIASIGNTGGYSKASLYFEIRQNGQTVNPRVWCR